MRSVYINFLNDDDDDDYIFTKPLQATLFPHLPSSQRLTQVLAEI